MTRRIRIGTDRPYDVLIGRGVQAQLRTLVGDDAVRVAIVCPPTMAGRADELRTILMADGLEVLVVQVPDGEAAKTADVLTECWRLLGENGFTRSDVVVGLGGGATTDLAGFVAATWLRGVRCVTVPTSVLGMVDAAVGGKTGINTAHGKNLVGAFHEPAGVLCDLDVLSGLPLPELRSGLAEVLKCGFIADPVILELFEADPAAALDPTSPVLTELIERGIAVKAAAVSNDLRETSGSAGTGIGREAVNYGHTLGHAIESLEHHLVKHGEAISIGMVFVAELAHRAGRIDAALVERHRRVLGAAGLPISYAGASFDELLAVMRLDKKSRGNELRLVVLDALADPVILAGPDEAMLRDSFRAVSR